MVLKEMWEEVKSYLPLTMGMREALEQEMGRFWSSTLTKEPNVLILSFFMTPLRNVFGAFDHNSCEKLMFYISYLLSVLYPTILS